MPKKRPVDVSERVLNLLPSPNTQTDWHMNAAASTLEAASPPPTHIDLRESWWNVGDQGQTGSCVGWATADGVLRYQLVKAKRIPRSERLSPRFVWMASKETDQETSRPETFIESSGTYLKAAADIVRKYGAALESDLPFQVQTFMAQGDAEAFYFQASMRRALNYVNLQKNLADWRRWLALGRPILAGFQVDASWSDVGADGLVGPFQPFTVRGGHAIAVVGYTPTHFLIRNSWGDTWGAQGFAWVTEDYVNQAFFPESYGFQV